ncbi:hypothetical protein ASG43_19040 [Aureimonas sp. Leaf454]|nr:hypothetical protein ASG43_19040 [Aureimonas sp. Leaf454]
MLERSCGNGRTEGLRKRERTCGVGLGENGGELFSAIAGRHVAWAANSTGEDVGNRTQAGVAGRVSVGIVEGLEVVDVGEEQGDGRAAPCRTRDFPLEAIVEAAAVRQSRHAIGVRQFV